MCDYAAASFSRDRLWKNGARFSATVGGKCGLVLREVDEGRGELGLFFSEETDDKAIEAARYQFEEFVRLHLDRRASKMARRRIFMCEEKHLPMDDRQVNERLKSGNDWMWCPYCDVPHKIRLLDRKQRLPAAISSDGVAAMDRAADARRAQETDKTAVVRSRSRWHVRRLH